MSTPDEVGNPKAQPAGNAVRASVVPGVSEPIPDDEARQAVDSIGGYAYQLYQTLLAWIALGPDELLFVEVAEDYAIATHECLEGVQVRRTATNITLRSGAVIDAINAFWPLQEKNPGQRVTFRYLTTSEIGREQGLSFPDNATGLDYWRVAARGNADTQPIRRALASLPLADGLAGFVRDATDDEFRAKLLRPLRWECGAPSLDNLRALISHKLVWRGQRVTQANVREIEALADPLLVRVLQIATKKADRQLSSVELDRLLQDRTQMQIPVAALRQLLSAQVPAGPPVALVEVPSDAAARPLPTPLALRTTLVERLATRLSHRGVVILHGASGRGKSTLARLVARRLRGRWPMIDFRSATNPQACNERLAGAIRTAADQPTGLILEDLPVAFDAHIEPAFALLLAALSAADQLLIITCSHKPSNRLLNAVAAEAILEAPNLDEAETRDLIAASGGDPELWATITHSVCGAGNPQLVHARVKRLAREGWPAAQLLGGVDPQTPAAEIEAERAAAQRRLMQELNPQARELIYRLSLIGGYFDRQLALAMAATPPPIDRAGEALNEAIGPWIEPLGGDYLRLSPLLAGSASDHFTGVQVRAIRVQIVDELMERRPLSGALLSTIFVHALACEYAAPLAMLSAMIMQREGKQRRYIAEQLFALQFLQTERPILPSDAFASTLLRRAQFVVCVEHEAWDLALASADRLIEESAAVPDDEIRAGMEIINLATVLSETRLPRSPRHWFRHLLRYRELMRLATGTLAEAARKGAEEFRAGMPIDIYHFLFAISATRRSSVAALVTLFAEFDALPAETRNDLLSSFDHGAGDLRLFVANAWYGEHDARGFDGKPAAASFGELAETAAKWRHTRLAVECVVAQSVMLDEYSADADQALKVLVDAEKRYGVKVELARQRAKVLHNKGDHAASLEVIRAVGDQIDPKDHVERTFAFRSAAMSAANLADWNAAIEFYSKARQEALRGKANMQVTAIGLLGDIAGAQLRAGDTRAALQTMMEALRAVEEFVPPKSPLEHCTRALISHVPPWMEYQLFKQGRPYQLPPGICSRSEPHQPLLERPVPPLEIGWYQLATIEQRLGLDVGATKAIEAWPNEKRITVLEMGFAKERIDRSVRDLDVGRFERDLRGYASSMEYLNANQATIRQANPLEPARGALPQVSASLEGQIASVIAANALLSFALIATIRATWSRAEELIQRLRSIFPGSPKLMEICTALEGAETTGPDASDIVARLLARLRTKIDALDPNEAFIVQCRLFDWSRQSDFLPVIAPPLLAWMRKTWQHISENQGFLLRNPRTTAPEILRALSGDGAPSKMIAKALLAAEDGVRTPLHEDLRALLVSLAT